MMACSFWGASILLCLSFLGGHLQGDGVITYAEFCKGLCLPIDDGDADKLLVGKRHTGVTEVRKPPLISVNLHCGDPA